MSGRSHKSKGPPQHHKSRRASAAPEVKGQTVLDDTFGLVNRTSATTQVAQTWKDILEEDTNYFEDINNMLKDPTNFQRPQNNSYMKHEDDKEKAEYWSGLNFSNSGSSIGVSVLSTIRGRHVRMSDPYVNFYGHPEVNDPQPSIQEEEPKPSEVEKNPCPCFKTSIENDLNPEKAQKLLEKCSNKMGKYYEKMAGYFDRIEAQLKFPTTAKVPPDLNIIAAQIWFITLVLTRRIGTRPINHSETDFFRSKYHRILAFAVKIQAVANTLQNCLKLFEKEGLDELRLAKWNLTNSSTTDLTKDNQTSEDDDFFVAGDYWIDLTRQGMSQTDWVKNKFNGQRNSTTTINMFSFDKLFEDSSRDGNFSGIQDTLCDRRKVEIFVRNVTKTGWLNFEDGFPIDQRVRLLRELLAQVMGKMAKLMSNFRGFTRMLAAANGSCVHASLMPWVRRMKQCCESIKDSSANTDKARFHLYAAELYLNSIIERGRQVKIHLDGIATVSVVCCSLLETKHKFFLPNFNRLSRQVVVKKKPKRLSMVNESQEDDDFYLLEYSQALKEIPIYFRVAQFLLAKQIEARERHSGADFDGIRFF